MLKVTARGVAAAVFVALVAGVCIRLGIWQLDRLDARRAANAVLTAAQALPPLRLPADVDSVLLHPEASVDRRARVVGTYDSQDEVVLRARARAGQPGVHLVAPLEIAGTEYSILVDRGWVPSPDATSVDPGPLAEPGEVVVEGILLPLPAGVEAVPSTVEVDGAEVLTLQRLDRALMQRRVSRPLLPLHLQRLPGATTPSEPPFPVPLPEASEGPHLSYALQWFSFAAIAVLGFLAVAYRASRREE